MNEQEFQLELERFKQKASWETKLFYFTLSALWGIVILGVTQNIKLINSSEIVKIVIFGLPLLGWFLILAGILIIGELIIQGGWRVIGYLNVQKEILRKKIIGKNAKNWDENKLMDLVVLEKKLEKKLLKGKKNEEKTEKLKSKIEILKKEIWGSK